MCEEKKVPLVHAEVIKAWADGAQIQCLHQDGPWEGSWMDCDPMWHPKSKYRVKPKPPVKKWRFVYQSRNGVVTVTAEHYTNQDIGRMVESNGWRYNFPIPFTEILVDAE